MAEAVDDGQYEELKRKLVGRIAVAGVAAIVLLAGLAVFDRLVQSDVTAPAAALREPAGRAPLPQLAAGGSRPASGSAPAGDAPAVGSPAAGDVPTRAATAAAGDALSPPAAEPPVAPLPAGSSPLQGSSSPLPADRPPAAARRVLAERQLAPAPPAVPEASALPQEPPPPVVAAVPSEPVPESTGGGERPARRSTPPTRLTHGYLLQVGVFGNAQRAGELHERLLRAGVPARLETRVQVGPFVTRQEAEQARERLKALGIESLLLPARAP